MSTSISDADEHTAYDAWVHALDALEAELDVTERLIEHGQGDAVDARPWRPPALAPMPDSLVVRAKDLLRHHRHLINRAVEQMAETTRAVTLLTRLDRTFGNTPHAVPVYLDITA